MVKSLNAQTLADEAYERIRSALVNGQYEAGARLIPARLAAEYDLSPTVVREALMRLSQHRLAEVLPNRGFHVVSPSLSDLGELVEVRLANELVALRKALEHGDLEWEGGVVAAHHKLVSADLSQDPDTWFDAHRSFHYSLLSACGNNRLLSLCSDLLEEGDLYIRWAGRETPPHLSAIWAQRDQAAEHQAILEAALARDSDLVSALYQSHLRLTEALAMQSQTPEEGNGRDR